MSRNGAPFTAPLFTILITPRCSTTNMRPSGRESMPTGPENPPMTSTSFTAGGVAATGVEGFGEVGVGELESLLPPQLASSNTEERTQRPRYFIAAQMRN